MRFFLGVDGGQSSTVALIADEAGQVLGAGRGGPCNHVAATEGRAKFAKAMADCLGAACSQAGLVAGEFEFAAACLGFSGGSADKEAYSREQIRSKTFKITHDAEIALTGATGGEPGIIVIAGTGSIAFGKNSAGKFARAGGWGYVFGDEGGAFDVVRHALRAALAMEEDWGPSTALRGALLAATEAKSANDLMHAWYNQFDRTAVARLAPVVDAAAVSGDASAIDILQRAGRELAGLVDRVHGQLFQPNESPKVSYVGGVFKSKTITETLRWLVKELVGCEASAPEFPPAAGALLEALRLTGHHVKLSNLPMIKS